MLSREFNQLANLSKFFSAHETDSRFGMLFMLRPTRDCSPITWKKFRDFVVEIVLWWRELFPGIFRQAQLRHRSCILEKSILPRTRVWLNYFRNLRNYWNTEPIIDERRTRWHRRCESTFVSRLSKIRKDMFQSYASTLYIFYHFISRYKMRIEVSRDNRGNEAATKYTYIKNITRNFDLGVSYKYCEYNRRVCNNNWNDDRPNPPVLQNEYPRRYDTATKEPLTKRWTKVKYAVVAINSLQLFKSIWKDYRVFTCTASAQVAASPARHFKTQHALYFLVNGTAINRSDADQPSCPMNFSARTRPRTHTNSALRSPR